ncbi:putative tetratricopeptide-like helical domain superfamily, pentacotripeptide-repeat region of PRORP [Helianthus debilis subsp. tardiflorus]
MSRVSTMTLSRMVFRPLNQLSHFLLNDSSITHFTTRHYYSSLPSHNLETVNKLIHIFTHQHPSSPELTTFGSKLTTNIVETVLKSFKNWETAFKFFNWASNQSGYTHNCYTYNAMASILSGVRQNAAMKSLCFDLINSRCYVSAGALGYFVRCLGGLGMVTEANEVFDHVKKMGCVVNDYSYNALLEAVSKAGAVELMAVRMSEMRDNGWKPDKYTLTSVLQCYCRAGMFENALDVFEQIDECGWVDSYVFAILIVSLSKAGEVDKAIRLIDKMGELNIRLNEKTFYVLIHGFVKGGKVDYALNLLKKMQSFGFVPGISLYAVVIEELCKQKEFKQAFELYSRMNETGIHPDVSIFKILISSLSDEEEMMVLLKEAKDHVDEKSMIMLLNTALTSLVKDGSTDKAHHLLKATMDDDGDGDDALKIENLVTLDASSFGIVIDGLCQKGELELALNLFNSMDEIGCKKSLLVYNNLINAFSNANEVEKCHELLNEMKTNGFSPSQFTHNAIFGYYCKIGDVNGAVNMLHELHTHGHQPWIKHYTLLVKKLSVNRKVADASSFLTMMTEEGYFPDMIAYSAVIDGWLKIGEVDYALKMFRDISANGRCPDVVAYNTIINGLCKDKRMSEARDIYDEMLRKLLVPSVVTYNLLIDAYCKIGEVDQAVCFFSMMSEKNRNPNVVTYSTLIDGLCNAGIPDEALLIWNEMVKVCQPNKIAFMALINGLCKCRKPDVGLVYFEEMEEKNMRADTYVYVTLVDAFISVSNAPMALCILRKMIQNERVPDSLDKNCAVLREALVKLLDDALTSSEIKTLVEDGSVPVHLLETSGILNS